MQLIEELNNENKDLRKKVEIKDQSVKIEEYQELERHNTLLKNQLKNKEK